MPFNIPLTDADVEAFDKVAMPPISKERQRLLNLAAAIRSGKYSARDVVWEHCPKMPPILDCSMRPYIDHLASSYGVSKEDAQHLYVAGYDGQRCDLEDVVGHIVGRA